LKKNGFTLVEIIAVIIILALIMILVTPNLSNAGQNSRKKIYQTKVEMIEDAAIIYGQDKYRSIINCSKAKEEKDKTGKTTINTSKCISESLEEYGYEEEEDTSVIYRTVTVTVAFLVNEDYYTPDEEKDEGDHVINPLDGKTYLDEKKVKIIINPNTRLVTSEFQE